MYNVLECRPMLLATATQSTNRSPLSQLWWPLGRYVDCHMIEVRLTNFKLGQESTDTVGKYSIHISEDSWLTVDDACTLNLKNIM